MTAQQFAKCAATYDFILDIIKQPSISEFDRNQNRPKMVANRAMLGTKYFSQKNAIDAGRANRMIQIEKNKLTDRVISGMPFTTLIAEANACSYAFLKK